MQKQNIDYVHIRAGPLPNLTLYDQFAKPLIFVGGLLRTVDKMVDLIKNRLADGIALGRPATAEPDIASKLITGKVCIALTTFIQCR